MSRLLGIFAHPDDESFGPGGALARYAAAGVDVHVCIVTDGAAGSYDPALLAASGCNTLAELRQQELACACRALGVVLHTLGYRDSGMAGAGDNEHQASLFQADLAAVGRDIQHLIEQVRPQVILSHDANGDYFHPDHIKVHQAVMEALAGLPAGARPRLYASAIPRRQVELGVRLLRLLRKDPTRMGDNGDIDFTRIGTPEADIHVRMDVGRYLSVKEEASRCHRSQGGGGGPRWLPRFVWRRFQRYEYFVQVFPQGAARHDDFFAAV
jgi:LmbE family N-acetylglucosaminyl deacetylase